jgi:hypothetical protein
MVTSILTTKTTGFDWSRADAMPDEDVHAAAMQDPDALPMTDAEWDAAPNVPRTRIIRRALGRCAIGNRGRPNPINRRGSISGRSPVMLPRWSGRCRLCRGGGDRRRVADG